MKLRTASGHRILVDEALSTDFDIPLSGGETGPAGVTGSPGVTGISAYQSAVDTGFQGDIIAWLTSLKGDPGNDGSPGSPGATGQQGVAGSPGSTGPQGLVGATGIQGVTGIQGITGVQGVTGLQGVTGVQGVTGSPGVGGAAWGGITGTLSAQADLQAALDGKQAAGSYAAAVHNHSATEITSGTVATARLGGGSASSSTFLRGDQTWATPAGGGGATVSSARVTADRTTTSASFADITDAAIAIGASETWSFEAHLTVGCNNTGGGQWTVTVPAGATLRVMLQGNTTSATAWTSIAITTSGANTVTMCAANAQGRQCFIRGLVVNSTNAGNIQIRHRAITAGQTVTTNANSYVTGRKH